MRRSSQRPALPSTSLASAAARRPDASTHGRLQRVQRSCCSHPTRVDTRCRGRPRTRVFIFQVGRDLTLASSTTRQPHQRGQALQRVLAGRRFSTLGSGVALRRHAHDRPEDHRDRPAPRSTAACSPASTQVSAREQRDHDLRVRRRRTTRRRRHGWHRWHAVARGGTGRHDARRPAHRQAPRRPARLRLPAARAPRPTTARHGSSARRPPPSRRAADRPGPAPRASTATVRGKLIRRVVFSLDGKRIGTRTKVRVPGLRAGGQGRQPRHQGPRRLQGRDPQQDAEVPLPRLRRRRRCSRAAARRSSPDEPRRHRRPAIPRPAPGGRGARGGARSRPGRGVLAAPARAADRPARRASRSCVLLRDHVARTRPSVRARRIEPVAARRPLTRVRTVLPVLGHEHEPRRPLPGCASASPAGPAGTPAGSRSSHTRATSTSWRHRGQPLDPPRHRLPRRPRRPPLPRHRRHAVDAHAARPLLHRGGRRALSRPPTAARSRWPPAPARTSCRSSRAAPARSPCTAPTASRARSGPRPRTAASASAPAPSPGSRGASAAACRCGSALAALAPARGPVGLAELRRARVVTEDRRHDAAGRRVVGVAEQVAHLVDHRRAEHVPVRDRMLDVLGQRGR